jgi:DNA-binding beta-propeller fold protein YncE
MRSLVKITVTSLAIFVVSVAFAQVKNQSKKIDSPIPEYAVDPYWPKALPNEWILGQVSGIAVDPQNHIWIIQRPRTLTPDELAATFTPPNSRCCRPAPPVIEFDEAGNILQAWGGPGEGYNWPKNEHGIYVDPKGNVWIAGNNKDDRMLLKFTNQGKFLMQIGTPGLEQSSNDAQNLGRPAHMTLDVAENEIYVADGYQNRRVIVFDADTGEYKRHWGAFGKQPIDGVYPSYNPEAEQFGNPVHCVRILNDGKVYVCDRSENRIQVFNKNGQFIRQIVLDPQTRGSSNGSSGSVWDLVPSSDKDQKFLFVADGTNNEVKIVLRESGEKVASFGRSGRMAGNFHWIHNIAIDSYGNIFTAEVDNAKRVQKFIKMK